jgi:hypothetical protein
VSPVTLDVAGDIALLSARGRGGLYAVRLSDGRTGFVGVNRGDDMPQVDLAGMVYQDDLTRYSPRHRDDARLLKFVPIAAIRHAIDVAGRPIVTPGRIRAMSMDGPRVALAVSDPRGVCDQVRFWIVAWNFTARLTNETGPTCRVRHAPGGITDVRVAGPRAEWVTTYGGVSTVFSASIISCQEWVLARLRPGAEGDRLAGLAGDGNVLTYAITHHEHRLRGLASVSLLPKESEWRTRTIFAGRAAPRALAADAQRVATLDQNGTVEIRGIEGSLESRFRVGMPRAIALRANRLVALEAGTVRQFNAATGELITRWPVPSGVEPRIDVHFGVAVLTRGHTVFGIDLETGRTSRLPMPQHLS